MFVTWLQYTVKPPQLKIFCVDIYRCSLHISYYFHMFFSSRQAHEKCVGISETRQDLRFVFAYLCCFTFRRVMEMSLPRKLERLVKTKIEMFEKVESRIKNKRFLLKSMIYHKLCCLLLSTKTKYIFV